MTEFEYMNGGNTEAQDKLAIAYRFEQVSRGKAKTGVLAGLGVAQTTSASVAVVVGAGAGVVQAATLDGASEMVNDTDKTLDILTGSPMGGLPRNDVVVFDQATTSVRAIIGTPNAAPTDPTVPSSAIPLARIRNAASATTIPSSAIDDLRVFTRRAGEAVPVADATARDALSKYAGLRVYRLDTNDFQWWDGTQWQGGPWIPYTPSLSGGGWALGNGVASGWWQRDGRTIHFKVQIGWGSTSTFGGAQLSVGLPAAHVSGSVVGADAAHALDDSASVRYDLKGVILASATSVAMFCQPATATGPMRAVTTSTPFTWANQDVLYVAGTYEAA